MRPTQQPQEQSWISDAEVEEFADNLRWLSAYNESRKVQPPTATEFWSLVEAEKANRLTEVEALHSVAAEHPEFYDAYRDAIFVDGKLPAPNVN